MTQSAVRRSKTRQGSGGQHQTLLINHVYQLFVYTTYCSSDGRVAAVACSTADRDKELLEEAMRQAGDNAGELQAVLDRYDDGRRELAEYAVAATWGR